MTSLYDYSARSLDGSQVELSRLAGQVVLVVNVASECGFTPQYEGLETLYRHFHSRGFSVLGFPCNQFGHQEPGDAQQIADFCQTRFQVSFPMFDKIDVNGPDAHPLFHWLKSQRPGVLGSRGIKWNFTKFLIGRDGQVLSRYGPTAKPASLAADIEAALGSPAPASTEQQGNP